MNREAKGNAVYALGEDEEGVLKREMRYCCTSKLGPDGSKVGDHCRF